MADGTERFSNRARGMSIHKVDRGLGKYCKKLLHVNRFHLEIFGEPCVHQWKFCGFWNDSIGERVNAHRIMETHRYCKVMNSCHSYLVVVNLPLKRYGRILL